MLKLDAAADIHHERLSVLRQAFENAYQISQRFVNLRRIGDGLLPKVAENLELLRNVFERDTLQLGTALQCLSEDGECGFDCLSALGKAIEKTCTIEVADTGDTCRVRLRLQVPPLTQLRESSLHLFYLRRWVFPLRLGKNLIGP